MVYGIYSSGRSALHRCITPLCDQQTSLGGTIPVDGTIPKDGTIPWVGQCQWMGRYPRVGRYPGACDAIQIAIHSYILGWDDTLGGTIPVDGKIPKGGSMGQGPRVPPWARVPGSSMGQGPRGLHGPGSQGASWPRVCSARTCKSVVSQIRFRRLM